MVGENHMCRAKQHRGNKWNEQDTLTPRATCPAKVIEQLPCINLMVKVWVQDYASIICPLYDDRRRQREGDERSVGLFDADTGTG